MSIEIIEGEPLRLTRDEYERFQGEYSKVCQYMVDPPSFESWVRGHKQVERNLLNKLFGIQEGTTKNQEEE